MTQTTAQTTTTEVQAATPARINLFKALLKAQKKIDSAKKNAENESVLNGKSYAYANLESIIKAIKEPLNDAGIFFTQLVGLSENGYAKITTQLIHADTGEYLESVSSIPMSSLSAQDLGSAITYLKKYSLSAILSLPVADDDGLAATASVKRADAKAVTASIKAPIIASPVTAPAPAPALAPAVALAPVMATAELSEEEKLAKTAKAKLNEWLNLIQSIELKDAKRLPGAKLSAKDHFAGDDYESVISAISKRERELGQEAQASQTTH